VFGESRAGALRRGIAWNHRPWAGFALVVLLCVPLLAEDAERIDSARGKSDLASDDSDQSSGFQNTPVTAFKNSSPETSGTQVQWKPLLNASLLYLGTMHAFRLATEEGTRKGLHNSVIGGYFKSLGAMHGWSDGDTYYENYLGHPLEGAVSGYIWIHNDLRYRKVQFGSDRDYWMSRLRAYAFAWAFSEQFEIGLMSEASIGQIQRYCCAYGFVDHVITPNGGLVWMMAGDALDRYLTVPIENKTRNTVLRSIARSALNPPQTFANLMMLQAPWHRENRAGVKQYDGEISLQSSESLMEAVNNGNPERLDVVPKFEIAASVPSVLRLGNLSCLGGGGTAAFRADDFWQWTLEVSGCTLGVSLPGNRSGDSLTFTAGPQWIVHTAGRWSPHAHFRFGGQKITEDKTDPKKRQQVLSQLPPGADASRYNRLFTQHWESTGLSISAGAGLDLAVNRGLAVRVANLEYLRSWLGNVNGNNFDRGLRFTTGLVLRVGNW
jgi:hypothetical protein